MIKTENKELIMGFRISKDDKLKINKKAKEYHMKVSEFIYKAVKEKIELDKLSDNEEKLYKMIKQGLNETLEPYFKKLITIENKINFNTKILLKQQDIFMYHVRVPQTEEELSFDKKDHVITKVAKKMIEKQENDNDE